MRAGVGGCWGASRALRVMDWCDTQCIKDAAVVAARCVNWNGEVHHALWVGTRGFCTALLRWSALISSTSVEAKVPSTRNEQRRGGLHD